MNMQWFTKYSADLAVLLLFAVMIITVPLIRPESLGSIGRESYFLERISQTLPSYDGLSYSGRAAGYNIGTPYLISLLPDTYWQLFSAGFAYLAAILFWLLLGKFGIEKRWMALLLFALMPTSLFLAFTLNRLVVPFALLLLSLLLLLQENKLLKALGMIPALLIPLFDFVFAGLAFILLLIFAFSRRYSRKHFLASAIILLLAAASYFLYLYNITGRPELFNPESQFFGLNYSLRMIISDFGGYAGLSLFSLILFSVGIISVWPKKYSRLPIFFLVSLLAILSLFRIEAVILFSLAVSAFGAFGIDYLMKSHWENLTLKYMVLLIVSCGILFSSLAYTKELVNSEPSQGIIFAMEFLSNQDDGVVFSDYSRGNWIAYAGKQNVLDQNFLFAPDVTKRFADSRKLLYTRDYAEASALFQKYGIRYIWMDDDLKNKLYSGREDGLLFLAKYSSNIKNIYNQDGVQIWEVGSK